MADAPQSDGDDSDDADEPLDAGELVFEWSNWDDSRAPSRLECDEEQDPNEKDRYDTHGKGDKEPDTP